MLPALTVPDRFLDRTGFFTILLFCWLAPISLGLCACEGQPRCAWLAWSRLAGRAVLVTLAGCLFVAVALALRPISLYAVLGHRWPALAAGAVLGLICGDAFALGAHHTRSLRQTLLAGTLAGACAGALWPLVLPSLLPIGLPGRLILHMAVLLPLSGLQGLWHAVLPEMTKRCWLQVLFGEDLGRHYLLSNTALTIGTAPDNLLVLAPTGGILAYHAVIRMVNGRTFVEPAAPNAILILAGNRTGAAELFDGNDLQIGETVLRYCHVP